MIYDGDCLRWLRNVPSGVPVNVDASYAVSVTAHVVAAGPASRRVPVRMNLWLSYPRNGSLEVHAAHSF